MYQSRLGQLAQVVAIMGPSGAGKTTLLYALMGTARYGVARGRLCVNGREMRLERLRRILGYVPQVCLRPEPGSGRKFVCSQSSILSKPVSQYLNLLLLADTIHLRKPLSLGGQTAW